MRTGRSIATDLAPAIPAGDYISMLPRWGWLVDRLLSLNRLVRFDIPIKIVYHILTQ